MSCMWRVSETRCHFTSVMSFDRAVTIDVSAHSAALFSVSFTAENIWKQAKTQLPIWRQETYKMSKLCNVAKCKELLQIMHFILGHDLFK